MSRLINKVLDKVPKLSAVVDGFSKEVMEDLPNTLNTRFKQGMGILEGSIDISYSGYRRLTPDEEYKMSLSNTGKTVVELADSFLYMVEFIFEYKNQKIRNPMLMPYSEPGNLIKFSNTTYTVTPVLTDRVFSPSDDSVFTKLLITKFFTRSTLCNFIVNGRLKPLQVFNTEDIARVTVNEDRIGNAVTPITLYLLAKFGLYGALNKYLGMTRNEFIVTDSFEDYDLSKYHTYESTKKKPNRHKDRTYKGHDIKILISKEAMNNMDESNLPLLEAIASSMLYSLDMLPDEQRDTVESCEDIEDSKVYWTMMLGKLLYKNSWNMTRIMADMKSHLEILDIYLDEMSRNVLKEPLSDFFDLIAHIVKNYKKWVVSNKEFNSSLENRYVDLPYYLSYDIVYCYHKVLLGLNKRKSKMTQDMSYKEVSRLFQELSTKKIYSLVKSKATNLTLTVGDYTGDLKCMKSTCNLEDQSRGQGVNRGSKKQFPGFLQFIHGEDVLIGTLLQLGKSAPTPRLKTNIYQQINVKTGELIHTEEELTLARELNEMLNGEVSGELADEEKYAELISNEEEAIATIKAE